MILYRICAYDGRRPDVHLCYVHEPPRSGPLPPYDRAARSQSHPCNVSSGGRSQATLGGPSSQHGIPGCQTGRIAQAPIFLVGALHTGTVGTTNVSTVCMFRPFL
ncbi:hypothetical protein C8Q78DRAFT_702420 [Trametes maxima]|nr:hypothetical protein C8Q78DRAFT_702420 [Trametes maxima]